MPKKSSSLPQFNDSHEDMANSFNMYFSLVGSLTALKADHLAKDNNWTLDSNAYETFNVSSVSEQFEFQPVSENDVANVILNLPSNKAPGFAKVPARILKDSLPATLQIITSLMNNSFKSNTFARAWKVAEVTCVPKDGDAGNPCSNRPISLLPVLSKVNERLAQRQFVTFLDNNNKLSQFQSGNRKYHSTETALLSVTDDLLKAMDEKKISILVLMDMSKAFDSINHDMLLFKLRSLGVSPSALEWFESYLKGRYQHVRIGDVASQSLPVYYGVPQGSILGPVLFTVYINDLLTVPKHCQSASYIDDSKLYLKFKTNEQCNAVSAVNSDLTEICKWCCYNSLLLNPDKTKVLVVGVPQLLRQLPDFAITLCGKPISPIPVAKDLGVFLDQCLSYNEHIRKTVASCMHKMIQINRIKHLFDKETLLLVINSFVFSRLFYCSSVWSNTSATNIHKLQLVQNFAARIILGLRKYDHISAGLRSLRWLNVKQRLMVNDAVMMHKCLKGLSPSYLSDKFSTRATIHERQTRNRDSLNIPPSRINAGQRAFYCRGVKVWNDLSKELREITNTKVFKRRLINELICDMN